MKIIDYYIAYATRLRSLEKRVNEYIKDGWQPLGGHVIGYREDGLFYSQVVVKYEEIKNDR